jgi:protein-arginine kinase activator protein McsA
MRTSFKVWLAIGGFFLLGAFVSNSATEQKNSGNFHQQLPAETANVVLEKVYQMNGLVTTEITLDTTQQGVCDTCTASFTDVLSTNRKLVDSLSIENSKLFDKYLKTIELNYKLDKVNKAVEKQLEQSNKLLSKK